jgi:hypothetical protein
MARIQALARDDYPLAERATTSRPTEVTFVRKEVIVSRQLGYTGPLPSYEPCVARAVNT